MQMLKAVGLNAVATYVFWNAHESESGKWDFTGDKNLAEYIRIAGEEGMELRRGNEQLLKYTQSYINRLYRELFLQQTVKVI